MSTEAPATMLLVVGGLAAICVAVWAAFTGQPWLAAGAAVAVLAAVAALQRIGQRHLPGDSTDTNPWSGHDPDQEHHAGTGGTVIRMTGPGHKPTVTEPPEETS